MELQLVMFHAAMSVGLVTLGVLSLTTRKSKHSLHPRVGEAYFWLLLVALGSGMVVGAMRPGVSIFEIATPPTLLLGILGYAMAKRRPRRWLGRPWLHWHIFGQGGSYIGVTTATLFQTVPRALEAAFLPVLWPPAGLLTVMPFALPTVIGSALIVRAQRKWIRTLQQPVRGTA